MLEEENSLEQRPRTEIEVRAKTKRFFFSRKRSLTVNFHVPFLSEGQLSDWIHSSWLAFLDELPLKAHSLRNIKGREASRRPEHVSVGFDGKRDELFFVQGANPESEEDFLISIETEFLDFPDNNSIRFQLSERRDSLLSEIETSEIGFIFPLEPKAARFGLENFQPSHTGRGSIPGMTSYFWCEANRKEAFMQLFIENYAGKDAPYPFHKGLRRMSMLTESLVREPLLFRLEQALS